jgi:hypothetical protein
VPRTPRRSPRNTLAGCLFGNSSQEATEGGGSQLIKIMLACDRCDAVIFEGISANEVRFEAKALYRRRNYRDLCLTCAGSDPGAPRSCGRATTNLPYRLANAADACLKKTLRA